MDLKFAHSLILYGNKDQRHQQVNLPISWTVSLKMGMRRDLEMVVLGLRCGNGLPHSLWVDYCVGNG